MLYSVQIESEAQLETLHESLSEAGIFTENVTEDETTLIHLRHMIGGATGVLQERLYEVEIPERAGALDTFLDYVSPKYQITMTHYRSDGGREGKVLFGMIVPPAEREEFDRVLKDTGYVVEDLTSNKAFNMLYGCTRKGACDEKFEQTAN